MAKWVEEEWVKKWNQLAEKIERAKGLTFEPLSFVQKEDLIRRARLRRAIEWYLSSPEYFAAKRLLKALEQTIYFEFSRLFLNGDGFCITDSAGVSHVIDDNQMEEVIWNRSEYVRCIPEYLFYEDIMQETRNKIRLMTVGGDYGSDKDLV
ncbi:MAG: hypothetical protein HY226_04320 [Candidatus Vogelbacteria bacterium]|nr:hypothetical protein [Candidatus Vogelbacteria bacterium]